MNSASLGSAGGGRDPFHAAILDRPSKRHQVRRRVTRRGAVRALAESSASLQAPGRRGAAIGRPVAEQLLRASWRVRVLGAGHVPRTGALIVAGNHTGLLDGPLMFGTTPRPVHILAKQELFVEPLALLLRATGQIPLHRVSADRAALRASLDVLAREDALGIFPEGSRGIGDFTRLQSGLVYLAARSGAPVQPVAFLGVRSAGQDVNGLPRPRARLDVVFGPPFTVASAAPAMSRTWLAETSESVRRRLAAHLRQACRVTGQPLPRDEENL